VLKFSDFLFLKKYCSHPYKQQAMCKTAVLGAALGAALVSMRAFVISHILLFMNLFSIFIHKNTAE
jgi:hypothetical protein